MSELKITIRNKVATADGQKIVCGNGDYTVHFDLDEEWADYATKTMRVVNSDRTYTDVVFTGAVANLPVLRNQSYVTIGLFAGNLHTSTPAYFNCSASILGGEGLPEAPEPDVYAQIMTLLNTLGTEIGDLDNLDTEAKNNLVAAINEAFNSGGGGGTSDHRQLTNRDAVNQHPISAITGLQTALDGKQPSGDYATSGELDALADIVDGKADAADIPSLDGYATEAYVQNYHDNTKQDVISDIASIRSGAALGATAVQPQTGKGLFSGNYNDLTDKPTIPSAVTESTVSGWGFTKNTGTYSKPSGGIPKTDLASAVQTSLGKADSALQSVPNTYALKTDVPTDAHINSLIDAKLGVIENGSY